jgi:hypothetical protein
VRPGSSRRTDGGGPATRSKGAAAQAGARGPGIYPAGRAIAARLDCPQVIARQLLPTAEAGGEERPAAEVRRATRRMLDAVVDERAHEPGPLFGAEPANFALDVVHCLRHVAHRLLMAGVQARRFLHLRRPSERTNSPTTASQTSTTPALHPCPVADAERAVSTQSCRWTQFALAHSTPGFVMECESKVSTNFFLPDAERT